MKYRRIVLTTLLAVLALCGNLWASLTTAYEAEMVVTGWLKVDRNPLGTLLGHDVTAVETFNDDHGSPAYHIVYLHPNGFVIVSADDMIEPIVGFSSDAVYDPSPDTPLGALVTGDLNGRIAGVRGTFSLLAISPQVAATKAQEKWNHLIGLALSPSDGIALMGEAPIEGDSLSDIRVAPLLKSKWGQVSSTGDRGGIPCYNYYTPQLLEWSIAFVEGDPNNYPSGCVATSMAQLMRYHRYPVEAIDAKEFTITVDDLSATRELVRGEGPLGAYEWDKMALLPSKNSTEEQRRAIGALCHDAGIAVGMDYTAYGSGATLYAAAAALVDTFRYSNAILGESESGENSGSFRTRTELREMINPNLDAGLPVIVGIRHDSYFYTGHAPICDGYGYNNSTLYHHFNMGWDGQADCWYNIPDVNVPDSGSFNIITRCIYNTFPRGGGEIISGRIIDEKGEPLGDVAVTARSESGGAACTAVTNDNGIYALTGLASDSTYTVSVDAFGYDSAAVTNHKVVATEHSEDGKFDCGNVWGVDFYGISDGDANGLVAESLKLTAADGRSDDLFGCSVALDGDYAIVGASGDNNYDGSAYVFKREGLSWVEQARLRDFSAERFGGSVGINGDHAIVGAGGRRSIAGPSGSYTAYLFVRNGENWARQAKLLPPNDSSGDQFGCSVAISSDCAIVGSSGDEDEPSHRDFLNMGSAFVFERNDADWTFSTRLRAADPTRHGNLGSTVSMCGDYVIAAQSSGGEYPDLYGSVYVFKRDGVSWSQQAKLTGEYLELFGFSSAISEDWAVVGAPKGDGNKEMSGVVYVCRTGTNWAQQHILAAQDGDTLDRFGHSVAICGDYIIVGAPGHDTYYLGGGAGSAYIFKREATGWTEQVKLTAYDGRRSASFGCSVAIDGDYAIVGADGDEGNARRSGSAYVFRRIGSTWVP